MTKNKKISLSVAGAMILSVFLPLFKMGGFGISLLDYATDGEVPELIVLLVLIIAFGVLTFMDKHLFARICSVIILLGLFYGGNKIPNLSGLNINVFDILGLGAYLLLLSSIAGVIFSKPESK